MTIKYLQNLVVIAYLQTLKLQALFMVQIFVSTYEARLQQNL
jgi:hypothetical protein